MTMNVHSSKSASPPEAPADPVPQFRGSQANNPEKSRLIKAYRRLMPERFRRVIAQRISVEARGLVMQCLANTLDLQQRRQQLRGKRLVRQYAGHLHGNLARAVVVDGRARIALVDPAPTPQAAQADALALICSTLENAGITHFCVRAEPGNVPAVAVDAAEHGRSLDELARLCARIPGYVSVVTPENILGRALPGFLPATWRRLAGHRDAAVIRVTWFRTTAQGTLVLGHEQGCEIEFWSTEDGPAGPALTSPRRNGITTQVPVGDESVDAPIEVFTGPLGHTDPDSQGTAPPTVRTRPEFTIRLPQDINFPIDVVYTWVDGADPAWARRRAQALREVGGKEAHHKESVNAARYNNRDELKYSLRSLHQYAPWVRQIILVTDDQTPAWLNTSHPAVRMVSHREIFNDPSMLPTFNSHAIESQLHHIYGLSENFLYLNDDVFIGNPLPPQTFFLSNGLAKFFPAQALVPLGRPSAADAPVMSAAKNNRALIEEHFSTTLTRKMQHVPHALSRSMLYEIEQRYSEQHSITAAARFRSSGDLSVTSSLHHYYAYHQSRAIPSKMRYAYMDVAYPNTSRRLNQLLSNRDVDVFCINDTITTDKDLERTNALITPFLESYFPVPSPFEKHG